MDDNDPRNEIISKERRWFVGVLALVTSIMFFLLAFTKGMHRNFLYALYFFVIVGACFFPHKIATQFFRILIVWSIALLIYGLFLYLDLTKNDLICMAVGLTIGGFAGYIGGLIGGWISGYYDPITRWTVMGKTARYDLAKGGAESASVSGVAAGLITGGVAGAIGAAFSPLLLVIVTVVIFWFIAAWVERAVGETIMGYPGGVILGAVFGVMGGYVGRHVATIMFSLS